VTRAIGRLTALKVERSAKAGMHADGGGLYLRITPKGARNWVLRYMLNGRPRWMGLGPSPCIASPRPVRGLWTLAVSDMTE
jgi:hypothetical protein